MIEVRKLEEENLYEVESQKHPGQYYVVDLIANSCTCPHYRYRGVQCKHIKEAQDALLVEKHIVTETCNTFQAQAPVLKDWFEVC